MALLAPFSHDAGAFVWMGGYEDTFVQHPHPRSQRGLDEYLLTGHYDYWREDLDRAASLGLQALRYGIPWYRVNPAPRVFDWTWTDLVIEYATSSLGLTLVLDLVHYGTPPWLKDGFLNPQYVPAVAAYARAVAERYSNRVHWYTPLNEPLITAEFCGLRGIWPPHQRGDDGFVRILDQVCRGVIATTEALRSVDAGVGIAHAECAALFRAGSATLLEDVVRWQARSWLPGDLLMGHVDAHHPLAGWLDEHGLGPESRAWYAHHPFTPDLWGVNYYPEISVHCLEMENGHPRSRNEEGWTEGLGDTLRQTYERFNVPLFVSETSTHGDDRRRNSWLGDSVSVVRQARAQHIPVLGYTWWPLLDLFDWSYGAGDYVADDFVARLGYPMNGSTPETSEAFARVMSWEAVRSYPLDRYLRRMGLWRLDDASARGFARQETATADMYRQIIREGIASVLAAGDQRTNTL